MSMSKQTPIQPVCWWFGTLAECREPSKCVSCFDHVAAVPTCHYCSGHMDDLSYSPYCGAQCAIDAEKDN